MAKRKCADNHSAEPKRARSAYVAEGSMLSPRMSHST
jgi:hypothetical protein